MTKGIGNRNRTDADDSEGLFGDFVPNGVTGTDRKFLGKHEQGIARFFARADNGPSGLTARMTIRSVVLQREKKTITSQGAAIHGRMLRLSPDKPSSFWVKEPRGWCQLMPLPGKRFS